VLLFFTTPEQEAVAIDSLERFAAAGLELPDGLEVHFHDDAEACGGHALAIAVHAEGFERVDMCTGHDFTLRHELAHIWAREHLDEATRAEFLEARGLDTWASTDQPWDRRGSEHLAHIIAWGLGDTPIRLGEIPDADFESLTEGFHLLTGRLPLHDVATSPEPDDDWSGVGLLRRSSGSLPLEAAAFEASAPLADAETAPFGAPPVEVWEPVDETDPLAAMPGPLDADEAPGDPDDTDDEEDDDLEAF
jgi:hypothetical protein